MTITPKDSSQSLKTAIVIDGRGFVMVSGKDASDYLQGQLSCDVTNLRGREALPGCCISTQGRIQSLFYIFSPQDQVYCLAMPRDLIPVVVERLKKYAVFSKVNVEDASERGFVLAVASAASPAHLPESLYYARLSPRDYEVYLPPDGDKDNPSFKRHLENAPHASRHPRSIELGLATIYRPTCEKFFPHDLGLQHTDAISFDKGCYTGQEIVARMHYRGKLKRALYVLRLSSSETDEPILPGTEIFMAHDMAHIAGTVVDCAGDTLLAVLDRNCTQDPLVLSNKRALQQCRAVYDDDNISP